MGRLTGRVSLLTGSTRGIGTAVAHRLAGEGARVVVHRPFLENSGEEADEEWRRLLAVKLLGPRNVLRALMPGMRARGWVRVVNVTSAAVIVGTAGHPAHAASKGALVGFTLSLALELADAGVCADAFAPVAVTDLVRSQVTAETLEYLERQGMPSFEDCADTLLPLVPDDAPNRQIVLMHLGDRPPEIVRQALAAGVRRPAAPMHGRGGSDSGQPPVVFRTSARRLSNSASVRGDGRFGTRPSEA